MQEKNYAEAKIQYQYALNIYQEISDERKVSELQGKIDITDGKAEQSALAVKSDPVVSEQ